MKMEVMSADPQLVLHLEGVDDVTGADEEGLRLQDAGGAAMLTNPVNKLRRGSAH